MINDHLRQQISSSVFLLARPCGKSVRLRTLAKQFLPYALIPCGDDEWVREWIVVNREYKPLGWPPHRRGHVHYRDPEFSMFRFAHDFGTDDPIFFYSGTDAPWISAQSAIKYVERLRKYLGISQFTDEGTV